MPPRTGVADRGGEGQAAKDWALLFENLLRYGWGVISIRTSALGLVVWLAVAFAARPAWTADAAALFASPLFLPLAHSHNDYEQRRPCLAAIESGVSSIEADLWLEGERVLVGHDQGKWLGDFETLYLQPLNELWLADALPVRGGEPFLLWLDLKDASAALGQRLHELLEACPCTRAIEPGRARVLVIITGSKAAKEAFVEKHPSPLITRDSNTFSGDDPPGSASWSWYALNWKTIGDWDGRGTMPDTERERLRALVGKIHAKGRKLRLWSHPATLEFWQEATAAGVDRLGTDVLPK
jgi:hypothetical protein